MANEMYLYGKGAVSVAGTGGITDVFAYGLPVMDLVGELPSLTSKESGKIDVRYTYTDSSVGNRYTGTAKLGVQGASSASYPKKNFTISKMSVPFEAMSGWGEQDKYCLKANYIDPSQMRNVFSARLWGACVKTREVVPVGLAGCPNYGAMNGFPIIVTHDGEFWGLYTMNIPKDAWAFGDAMYVVTAEQHSAATSFQATITQFEEDVTFALEVGEDEASALTSLNRLLSAVINYNADDSDTVAELETVLDIPSAIDYYVYSTLLDNLDGLDKNYILSTYDGVKWYFNAYDVDSTFGLHWDGTYFHCAIHNGSVSGANAVFTIINSNYHDVMVSRYNWLKANAMSAEVVEESLSSILNTIPLAVKTADSAKWGRMYGTSTNNYQQIVEWYYRRIEYINKVIL